MKGVLFTVCDKCVCSDIRTQTGSNYGSDTVTTNVTLSVDPVTFDLQT